MDLSVILSAHNSERTLEASVRSTLRAMPVSSELLVCLHKCSDDSGLVISEIKDNRLRVFSLETGGFADSLNFLISKARGSWIARMDADDICLPWRFESQIKFMRRNSHLDLMFSTAILFGEGIKPLWVFPQYLTGLSPAKFSFMMSVGNPAVHPTLFSRRQILIDTNYEDVPGEDLDLWLRLILRGVNIGRSRVPTILYRSHLAQMSRREPYVNGWRNSPRIISNRDKLRNSDLYRLYVGDRLSFMRTHPLLAFEIIGFPTVGKVRRWLNGGVD